MNAIQSFDYSTVALDQPALYGQHSSLALLNVLFEVSERMDSISFGSSWEPSQWERIKKSAAWHKSLEPVTKSLNNLLGRMHGNERAIF